MKKELILICSILLAFNIKTACATSCSGEYGTIITGVNGKSYCLSKHSINWWSTFSWCNKVEDFSEPISIADCDCTGYEGCDETVACPNLKIGYNATIWTSTNIDAIRSVSVKLSTGNFNTDYYYHADSVLHALCK